MIDPSNTACHLCENSRDVGELKNGYSSLVVVVVLKLGPIGVLKDIMLHVICIRLLNKTSFILLKMFQNSVTYVKHINNY